MENKGADSYKKAGALKVGDKVKIKGTKDELNSIIERKLGNDVVLSKPLRGFRYYDIQELIGVK